MILKVQIGFLFVIFLCTLAIFTIPTSNYIEKNSPCHPDPLFVHSSWYVEYASRVYSVQGPSNCTDYNPRSSKMDAACARWWHPTPRFFSPYKPRKWSGVLRPKDDIVPICQFGQSLKKKTKCSAGHQKLFEALDKLRVVYFPRSGSELGIVRESSYLSDDGDLDIFVDMPQSMLHKKLKKMLKPAPGLSGGGSTAEVHWKLFGCPEVHMVFNDWMSLELEKTLRSEDLCSCRLNSVNLLCHRDGVQRMYAQYGPSWRVPLGIKYLDAPHYVRTLDPSQTRSLANKLKKLVNTTTDRIEMEAVNKLVEKPLQEDEMNLVLAQLNVIANSLNLFKNLE